MFGTVPLAYQLSPEQRVAGVMCRALSRNLALDLAGEGAQRAADVARKATTHLLQRTSTQDLERMQFETVTEEHAQSAEDFGLEFSTGRERSRVPGIDPPPRSMRSRPRASRTEKATSSHAENMASFLKAATKNVSPERLKLL